MKKILSLFLALVLILSLAGCSASELPLAETTQDTQTEATTITTTAPEETTAPTQAPTTEPETEPATKPTEKPKPKPTEPTQTLPEQTDPPPETQPPLMPPETEPATEPTQPETQPTTAPTQPETQKSYTRRDEVAQYIHAHGCLPDNFITKSEAKSLGWKSGRLLNQYAPGKCIGGDRFYNKEGLLPAGHTYFECDIDTLGKTSRGAKRIVFSSDGLIFYTDDHYKSFYQFISPDQWEKL